MSTQTLTILKHRLTSQIRAIEDNMAFFDYDEVVLAQEQRRIATLSEELDEVDTQLQELTENDATGQIELKLG